MTGDDHAAVTVRGEGPVVEIGTIEVRIQKTGIDGIKTETGECGGVEDPVPALWRLFY